MAMALDARESKQEARSFSMASDVSECKRLVQQNKINQDKEKTNKDPVGEVTDRDFLFPTPRPLIRINPLGFMVE